MNSRWKWGLSVTGTLIVAIALYVWLADVPVAEMADLASEGGESQLRDPMRPARGTTRVLLFALDGVGEDELLDAVRRGGAPNIAAVLGAESDEAGIYAYAYAVPGVLSVLPSTTLAAWASLFTGEPPARTGVPGNEWFAREERRFYAPAPVTIANHEHAIEVYTDGLVGSALRVPTLYELAGVRSYVSLAHVHRGADLLTMPELSALGDLIVATAEGLTGDDDVEQEVYAELDETSVESLIESIQRLGIADLQTIYFPGVDLYTHVTNQPIPEQRRYLQEVIDPAIGRVLDVYRVRGELEDTYVVFVADHGHTPMVNDDRHSLGTEGDDEPPALIERTGFRVRPFELELDEKGEDYQAVVAYQGAFAYVYLADRSLCPDEGDCCDWMRPPRLEGDVLPMVRAFDETNRTGAGVPQLQGTLDLIFARDPRATDEDALPFQVWDGERLVPVGEYLANNPRPELLELESRLEGLSAGPFGHRAGDILLMTRSEAERPIEDRFYFSGRYRSWHGSASAQDSRIPLVVARQGRTGSALRDEVRNAIGAQPSQLSVTPLIQALLSAP